MASARKHSLETKRKISLAQKGTKNSMYGLHHNSQTLRQLSRINTGKGNPMYGRSHTPATIRKISLAARRRSLMRRRSS